MKDPRRISAFAILFLVLLRICIGWQFLYEGMWKLQTQSGPNPWTAKGFLANAQGPLRDVFRQMTGDPDDAEWLAVDETTNPPTPHVQYRWDEWLQAFGTQYQLEDAEFGRLSRRIQGPQRVASDAFDLPEDVTLDGRLGKLVPYDAESRKLILQTSVVDGEGYWTPKYHLIPADRAALLNLVPDVTEVSEGVFESENDDASHVTFAEQVHLLYERQSKLSYFERLRAIVLGDPELITISNEAFKGSVDERRLGKIDQYRRRLARYEEQLKTADIAFQRSHLAHEWKELQAMRAELVGPIKELETEMKKAAYDTLTAEQRALGPPVREWTPMRIADTTAIWSLIVLGGLLMLGLFSRLAALMGAGMLLTFYLVWPPFPGVPEAAGPEHALIVNKNLIEAIALLALVFVPSGTWFGLDNLFAGSGRPRGPRTKPSKKKLPEKKDAKSEEKPAEADTRKKAAQTLPPPTKGRTKRPRQLLSSASISASATPEAIERLSRAAGGEGPSNSEDEDTKRT